MTEYHEATIRVLNTLAEIHKRELSAMSERHELKVAIRESYFKGFKEELLDQLTMERLKVIELQNNLDAKNARIAELEQQHPE